MRRLLVVMALLALACAAGCRSSGSVSVGEAPGGPTGFAQVAAADQAE